MLGRYVVTIEWRSREERSAEWPRAECAGNRCASISNMLVYTRQTSEFRGEKTHGSNTCECISLGDDRAHALASAGPCAVSAEERDDPADNDTTSTANTYQAPSVGFFFLLFLVIVVSSRQVRLRRSWMKAL